MDREVEIRTETSAVQQIRFSLILMERLYVSSAIIYTEEKAQRGGAKLTSSHLKLKFPSAQWEIKNSEVLTCFKAN